MSTLEKFHMRAPQRRGCPLKYAYMVNILMDDGFYTAAMIADEAVNHGLIYPEDLNLRRRVRMSFNKVKTAREFPIKGDKMVRIPGQRPYAAYLGKRWKAAVDYRTFFSGPKPGRKHSSRKQKKIQSNPSSEISND